MALKFGFLALLEAKPGKSDDLADFLRAGRDIAAGEEGTATWYAFKVDDTTYGVFDTFETADAQQAHLNGEIPNALGQIRADLLDSDPDIRSVEIVAVK